MRSFVSCFSFRRVCVCVSCVCRNSDTSLTMSLYLYPFYAYYHCHRCSPIYPPPFPPPSSPSALPFHAPLAYLLALILHPMMLAGWQVYPFLFCPCQSFVLLWLVVYVVCGWGEKCCCLSLVLLILRSYNLAFIHSFMRASIRLIWYRCQGDREGEGTGGRRGRRKPS